MNESLDMKGVLEFNESVSLAKIIGEDVVIEAAARRLWGPVLNDLNLRPVVVSDRE